MKKRILALCLFFVFLLGSVSASGYGELANISEVHSDAYLVMDAATGQILTQKNGEKIKYPASITKILTLALALEHGSLDDTLTVSTDAVDLPYNVSHIALQPGEVISVRDACMAALLASANDAANCLAEYVSGSEEAFAQLMNDTAQSIGCRNTHFVNASGLPDDGHYTTVYDMALITRYALSVPGFRELFSITEYTMQPTNLQPEARLFGTQNAMIVTSAFFYDGAWGGKLGWTEEAHHTMVTTVNRDGQDLILVTMDCENKYDKYNDGICILDTCAAQLTPVTLPAAQTGTVTAPIRHEGTQIGTATYSAGDLTLYLPAGASAADVSSEWSAPASLNAGAASPAQLTLRYPSGGLGGSGETVMTVAPVCETEDAPAFAAQISALTTAEIVRKAADTAVQSARPVNGFMKGVGITVLVCAGLILAAYCVRWYNLARRRRRRRAGTLRSLRFASGSKTSQRAGTAVVRCDLRTAPGGQAPESARRPDTDAE